MDPLENEERQYTQADDEMPGEDAADVRARLGLGEDEELPGVHC